MNPIESDGVAAIFSLLRDLSVETLDISGCSMCQSIIKLFMQLIIKNKSLVSIDISNNDLGEVYMHNKQQNDKSIIICFMCSQEFGKQLYKIIGFNKVLQHLDLRNAGLSLNLRNQIKAVLEGNKVKTKLYLKTIVKNI